MTKQELLDKANDLPLAPGVYLMMDKTGCVIYVGKAKKLKNRVSQYFQENSSHNEKTRRMVSQVDHFDTIFVSTEFEALILENSLIKQHMPRYNILLKDDKGYPFVRLGTEHYPRFTMASKPADDNALYFGPFGGRNETRAAIDAICAAFRLPTCSRKFPRDIGKERPCLNHHMGRCDAFCRGTPDEDEYMRRIGQAEELLNGHYRRLTRALREEMEQEAADLHFEQAAALRDRIRAIEVLGKRQKVIAGICADTDIWGVYRGALKCGSAVLHIEDGSVTGRDLNLFAAPQDESEQMILSALLPQYYLNKSVLPREILLPCEIEGADELAQILTERAGHKVTLHVPQRGEKAELLAMAQRNAREDVERVTTAQERENRTLTQLAGMLSLPEPPERMESYDISNTGASDIVASMVVYEGAKPKKSAYRRFKIKSLSAHPERLCLHGGGAHAPHPALSGRGREIQPPAGCHAHRRRHHARGRRRARVRADACACADLRHGQGRPPPHARARHRTGPRDRPARRAERLRPDRSDPGGDAPLCHHVPPREPFEVLDPLGTRRDSGRRQGARSGAAQDVQER